MFSVVGKLSRSFSLTKVTSFSYSRRFFGGLNVPFQEELSEADYEDFNLQDFQHFKGLASEQPENKRDRNKGKVFSCNTDDSNVSLEDVAEIRKPMVLVSRLNDPYMNLAIEDYLYNKMPIPKESSVNYNRLFLYIDSPCVVVGKNQNAWKEVNVPLLTSLGIPLVRRRSGGGTVVHDLGNVNFSFMTTKQKFDRFKFAETVKDAVNSYPDSKYKLMVNERGDITTEKQSDGIFYKVSGSAYKLSKGKSYHHGTMLLDVKLDVLSKLLSRDESKIGKVDSMGSVDSIKSKVKNIELSSDVFIDLVSNAFWKEYGINSTNKPNNKNNDYDDKPSPQIEQTADSISATHNLNEYTVINIGDVNLPKEVLETTNELREWDWRFGNTPKFTHEFYNAKLGFSIKFHVDRKGILSKYELAFEKEGEKPSGKLREAFEFLDVAIKRGDLLYKGSDIAGYVLDDDVSDWIGQSIDNTV